MKYLYFEKEKTMADNPRLGRESPVEFSWESGLRGEKRVGRMDFADQAQKTTERSESFVLEMDSLSLQVAAKDLTLQRSLSRKGSMRGDRKLQERETDRSPSIKGGVSSGHCAVEKAVAIHLGGDPPATTDSNRGRRYGGRRPSWIDPKKILLVFATLSSMGTIILIYFTLSMSKINGEDAATAQQ